jgi:hypothetical protein
VFAPTGAWKRSFELPKPSLVVGFANGQLYADKDLIGLLFGVNPQTGAQKRERAGRPLSP